MIDPAFAAGVAKISTGTPTATEGVFDVLIC